MQRGAWKGLAGLGPRCHLHRHRHTHTQLEGLRPRPAVTSQSLGGRRDVTGARRLRPEQRAPTAGGRPRPSVGRRPPSRTHACTHARPGPAAAAAAASGDLAPAHLRGRAGATSSSRRRRRRGFPEAGGRAGGPVWSGPVRSSPVRSPHGLACGKAEAASGTTRPRPAPTRPAPGREGGGGGERPRWPTAPRHAPPTRPTCAPAPLRTTPHRTTRRDAARRGLARSSPLLTSARRQRRARPRPERPLAWRGAAESPRRSARNPFVGLRRRDVTGQPCGDWPGGGASREGGEEGASKRAAERSDPCRPLWQRHSLRDREGALGRLTSANTSPNKPSPVLMSLSVCLCSPESPCSASNPASKSYALQNVLVVAIRADIASD